MNERSLVEVELLVRVSVLSIEGENLDPEVAETNAIQFIERGLKAINTLGNEEHDRPDLQVVVESVSPHLGC